MRVLIACEFSGLARDAFIAKGHQAMSCDLLESERPGPHYRGNMWDIISPDPDCQEWDMILAFPDCEYMASSGNRWWAGTPERDKALTGIRRLMALPVSRLAIENPVGAINSQIRQPDQIIQPWQFGHGEVKATCLWLRGLPQLKSTNIVAGRNARVWREPPGPNRWRNRARTLPGIAEAMASQWSTILGSL